MKIKNEDLATPFAFLLWFTKFRNLVLAHSPSTDEEMVKIALLELFIPVLYNTEYPLHRDISLITTAYSSST